MLGKIVKKEKKFVIVGFSSPDVLILKGNFVDFETSLKKSHENGYTLEDCDDVALLHAWEQIKGLNHE